MILPSRLVASSIVIRRLLFPTLILLCVAGTGTLRAELTEEQKKELIRKQHAASSAQSAKLTTHKKSGSGSGNSSLSATKKKKSSSGSGHSGATKKKTRSSHSNSSPSTASEHGHSSLSTYHAAPSSPQIAAPPSSLPLPHGAEPSAPITIEKSGVEADQGMEPIPTPAPAHEGFWSRLFGSHKAYAYLSLSVRSAIDYAPVKRGRWKYIVVHNSGTREGNARVFDIYHRRVRHMENGLAYHFVIGDGHGSGDGQIEIGPRWTHQINGGHVASDYLNDISLGICLVGDFNRDLPTRAQIGALEELTAYLRNRVGRAQGRQAIVYAHKEINPRPTDCPGGRFPYGWLHAKFGNER